MKKIYCIAFVWSLLAIACASEEDLVIPIVKSYTDPDENLNDFRQKILAANNGWKGLLRLKAGGMNTFFLELQNNGNISMMADVSTEASKIPRVSKYTIETTQGVNASIIFKDGSYLNDVAVSKPNFDKSFAFKSGIANGDTLMLVGNQYGDELILIKASSIEHDRFTRGDLSVSVTELHDFLDEANFLYAKPGPDKLVQFIINPAIRQILFSFVSDGSAKVVGYDYAYTLDGIMLNHSLNLYGTEINELLWDNDASTLYMNYKGTRFNFQNSGIPLVPLHYLLEKEYPFDLSLQSPTIEEVPGWSASFKSAWLADETALQEKNTIELFYVDFDFGVNNTLKLNVYFNEGGSLGKVRLPYLYNKTSEGHYTFAAQPIDSNIDDSEKARQLRNGLPSILSLIENNNYTIEFQSIDSKYGLLVRFQSLENSGVYFTAFFF